MGATIPSTGLKADGTLAPVETNELGQLVGAALGSAMATAGAVWGALVRPMQKKLSEASEAAKVQDPEIPLLRQRVAELERRLEKTEDKANRAVTEDEFEAYTSTTNKNVQALTEKIGSATGSIEAWYRLQSGGR
jgi:hypothetical protein